MTANLERGRPLRVLHCIPSIWSGSGGPTRAVLDMTRAVAAAAPDTQIDIATTDFGLTPEWHAHIAEVLPPSSRLFVHPQSRWLDSGGSLSLAAWLWARVRDYDVVHVHSLFASISTLAAAIAQLRGVPYVLLPHGTLSPYTFRHRRRLLKRVYFRLLDRRTVSRSAVLHLTAPQEALKASRLGLRVPTAVVPLPFAGAVPEATAEAAGENILFLSRLHPVKGLDLLLPAFVKVRERRPQAVLVIAGSGTPAYEAEIRRMVQQLGLEDAVRFEGFVEGERKRQLLREAALFVLPSYQENFGVAVIEALAAGRAAVITREVDLWPDLARYDSGLVVEADVQELAGALLELLDDPQRRREMGENGARQVRECYSPAVVGEQLVNLYRRASASRTVRVRDERPMALSVNAPVMTTPLLETPDSTADTPADHCPLCGGAEFADFRQGLLRCTECALVVNPLVWDEGADARLEAEWFDGGAYQVRQSAWTDIFERWSATRTWRRLRAAGIPSGRILEVGVGSGALLALLRDKGYEVAGCDVSGEVCATVSRRRGVPMHHCTLDEVPGQGSFDAVVMNHVIEHVSDPVELLASARRLLRPGGVVHVATPNVRSWNAALGGWTSYQPYHFVYFSPETLTRAVDAAGLRTRRMSTTEPFSGWFLTVLRTLVGASSTVPGRTSPADWRRPPLVEHAYRVGMVVTGALTTPLRSLQARLGRGEEVVVLASADSGQA